MIDSSRKSAFIRGFHLMPEFLIYGANGYTGRLIAREAVSRGLSPIVAGRNQTEIAKLADELKCESRTFRLDDRAETLDGLRSVRVVLNCAGPFARTAAPLIDACLQVGASYLDITGEIDVIEQAATFDAAARAAGVTICPAVGFDVVPTDCLAAMLHEALPDASHLTLAFTGTGVMSPGTLKTALEGIPRGGRVRREGRIERVPALWKTRTVPFLGGPCTAVTIPWGDVASAFHTTGIPNIDTYMAMPPRELARMRRMQWFTPLLKMPFVLRAVQRYVAKHVRGPDDAELASGRAEAWGEVRNAAGRTLTATLTTPNAYRLTVLTAVAAVERVLNNATTSGSLTPARAFGKEFITTIPGVEVCGPTETVPYELGD